MKKSVLDELPSHDTSAPLPDAPKTMSELVYRKLRSDIVWGVLKPGAALRNDELRETYRIGISPLREALTKLVAERLVTSVGQRGFRVATINARDVEDVTETRLIIERAALANAIAKGDLAWEQGIVSSLHGLTRVAVPRSPGPGADLWTDHHRKFHLALLSGCGSVWQLDLSSLLFDQSERFRIFRATRAPNSNLSRDTTREHQDIASATLARKTSEALEALDAHYRSTMKEVLSAMQGEGGSTD